MSTNIGEIYKNYAQEKLTILLSCKDTLIKKFEKVLEINEEIADMIEDDTDLQEHTDEATEFEIKVRNDIKIIDNFIAKKSENIEPITTSSITSTTIHKI